MTQWRCTMVTSLACAFALADVWCVGWRTMARLEMVMGGRCLGHGLARASWMVDAVHEGLGLPEEVELLIS